MSTDGAAMLFVGLTLIARCAGPRMEASPPMPRVDIGATQVEWFAEVPDDAFADPVLEWRFSLDAPESPSWWRNQGRAICGTWPAPRPLPIEWALSSIDVRSYRPIDDWLSVSGQEPPAATRYYRFEFVGNEKRSYDPAFP